MANVDLSQLDAAIADFKSKEAAFEAADGGQAQANAALDAAKAAAQSATDAAAAARQAKDVAIDAIVSILNGAR